MERLAGPNDFLWGRYEALRDVGFNIRSVQISSIEHLSRVRGRLLCTAQAPWRGSQFLVVSLIEPHFAALDMDNPAKHWCVEHRMVVIRRDDEFKHMPLEVSLYRAFEEILYEEAGFFVTKTEERQSRESLKFSTFDAAMMMGCKPHEGLRTDWPGWRNIVLDGGVIQPIWSQEKYIRDLGLGDAKES